MGTEKALLPTCVYLFVCRQRHVYILGNSLLLNTCGLLQDRERSAKHGCQWLSNKQKFLSNTYVFTSNDPRISMFGSNNGKNTKPESEKSPDCHLFHPSPEIPPNSQSSAYYNPSLQNSLFSPCGCSFPYQQRRNQGVCPQRFFSWNFSQ